MLDYFRAVGPAFMTRRRSPSAFRPLAALFLMLCVLLGGSIEAAACEPAAAFEQIDIVSSDGDEPSPGEETVQHGVCAHGHCHHSAQFIESQSDTALMAAAMATHFGLTSTGLGQTKSKLIKEPPRR